MIRCRFMVVALALLLSGHVLSAQSNEGKLFWFGFMEHIDDNNTKVVMITAKQATSGVVEIPLRNWRQSFSVGANQVAIIQLPAATENRGSEIKADLGMRVVANDPVSVYIHQYFNMRSEATVVLPVESTGRSYYVMSYPGYLNPNNGEVFSSEFLIVAGEDDTDIAIRLSDRTRMNRPAGSTININLNAGESYQVQADLASGDLTGTFITGNKKFTVLAGNEWTGVPVNCNFRDNLLEMMIPLETWGRQFVSIPNARVSFDQYRILAAEENTSVRITGGPAGVVELDAGEFYEFSSSEAQLFEANRPILVAQYLVGSSCNGHTVGDPSMVLLNSVEQTRDTVTLYNSTFENITENYINVIMQVRDVPSVRFDGVPLDQLGVPIDTISGNLSFAYARIQVGEGAHTIISEGCGVIATAYGYGNVESYAYSGGASFSPINANPIPLGGCLNDTIFFDTGLSPFRFSFDWDLGDGSASDQARFTHFYSALGAYPVRLILTDNCLGTVDTLYRNLQITLRQAVDAPPLLELCQGEPIDLSATDVGNARYEWTGPQDFFSESQFPRITEAVPANSGAYRVIGIVSGCATFPAFTEVTVHPTPEPDLGPDQVVCPNDPSFSFELDPGDFAQYRWQDGSTAPTFEAFDDGLFWVEVTDAFGCVAADSILLIQQCPTKLYAPTAFSPNGDLINDEFRLFGSDITSIRWKVFDRWGNLVFSASSLEETWNGTFRGQDAPVGAYIWTADIQGFRRNGDPYRFRESGSVALVR